jgi:hypothetical protein
LHDPEGRRLMGFDNAHGVPGQGARYRRPLVEHDHWHRTTADEGRRYEFTTIDRLLTDFQHEVERVLRERGIGSDVIGEGDTNERTKR